MRAVVSPSCLATGAMRSSNRAPSASSTPSAVRACGSPEGSVGKRSRIVFMSGSLLVGVDLAGEVLGVVLDPSEQRGPPRVQPRQAEEVEARGLGHAPAVDHAP